VVESILDERLCSEEEEPVEKVVGTVVLTDGDGDGDGLGLGAGDGDEDGDEGATVLEDDDKEELPPAVPEGVPPRLK